MFERVKSKMTVFQCNDIAQIINKIFGISRGKNI